MTSADASSQSNLQLGFIGLGNMGAQMAGRLVQAGHAVTVFDLDSAAMARLTAQGARAAGSVAEIAAQADIVFASLPTPNVVRAVIEELGEGGRARTFIDLSTTGPVVAAEVGRILSARGIAAVDAPVSGGVKGAQMGTLAVMVSCREAVFPEVRPFLEVFGKPFFLGETPGSAQTMKLANNLLAACAIAISAEAMVMGVKAGLDPQTMIDVISASSGRNSAIEDKFPRAVLPGTFDFGFATGLSYKDVRLCLDAATALGVPMVVGSAVREMLAIANAHYGPESDFTVMVRTIEEWAGVEVRSKAAAKPAIAAVAAR